MSACVSDNEYEKGKKEKKEWINNNKKYKEITFVCLKNGKKIAIFVYVDVVDYFSIFFEHNWFDIHFPEFCFIRSNFQLCNTGIDVDCGDNKNCGS